MPRELFDAKELKAIFPRAEEIRLARNGDRTKLKVRTKSMLYTYVTTESEADRLLKGVDKDVVEFAPKPKAKKEEKAPAKKAEVEAEEAKEEQKKEAPEGAPAKKPKKPRSRKKKKEADAEEKGDS